MKSRLFFIGFSIFLFSGMYAQNEKAIATKSALPYHEIPDYPESYTAENVAARMLDGLGYRYYWATEGLTDKDLNYQPSDDGRTAAQTLDHIYGLTQMIVNATKQQANVRSAERAELTFEEKRKQTLENIKMASDLLKASDKGSLEDFKIIFQRGDSKSEFPFWNLLNGPLADAIYHVGQIVSHRRASGNPMDPRVNVFSGKNR